VTHLERYADDAIGDSRFIPYIDAWSRYAKTTDGPAIAAQIGLGRLRESCPHFGAWISRLESL
jgi:hypothetical protein